MINNCRKPHINSLRKLKQALSKLTDIRENEPMSKHCTFRVGGNAEVFVEAHDAGKLEEILRVAIESGIQYKVIGGGSNILVSDLGVSGLVIENKSTKCVYLDRSTVRVDSGFSLTKLAKETASKGLSGLEWAVGIPGSLGGAIAGNAGAYGKCIGDVLLTASIFYETGEQKRLPVGEMGFTYRSSFLKGNTKAVVLSADLVLVEDSMGAINERIDRYKTERRLRQPQRPSAGSVFKNPQGMAAGYLIEQSGLKGMSIGNARISPKHANFIINSGNATAQNIKELIDFIRVKVKTQFGIELQLEIELVGDWN